MKCEWIQAERIDGSHTLAHITRKICSIIRTKIRHESYEQEMPGNMQRIGMQAMMIGKASVFDRQEWLQIQPARILPYGHQPQRRLYVLTKLPRLTALVRAVRENPEDEIPVLKATALAEELLNLDWGVSSYIS